MKDFNETTGVGISGSAETEWIYDSQRGWLDRKEYDDGNGTDYTYTDGGRLASRTWERGVVTNYAYNRAGDLLAVDYSDSTVDVAYTYTRFGGKDAVDDGSFATSPFTAGAILASAPSLNTTRYTYDYAYNSRLQIESETISGVLGSDILLTRDYEETGDTVGRVAGYELGTSADNDLYGEAAYTYDNVGRLKTVADGSDTFTYAYTANSNLLASITGPYHDVTYAYEDGRNAIKSIENDETVGTPSVVSTYTYTMNTLGQREFREQSGSAYSATTEDGFTYDQLGQVTDATNDTETAAKYNPSYRYDEIGNRDGNTVDVNGTTGYTANAVNAYTGIGSASPTYDDDGNLTGDGTWSFTWDAENRLINADDGSADIDYKYDYRGRLVARDDQTDTNVYIYDGWNRIGKFVNGSHDTAYLWGQDLSGSMQGAGGVGGLLKEGSLYPLYDANGNIMQKIDSAGTTAMAVDYDPFGNVIAGSLTGDYGFSTKPLDADTDLYYYGYRWYSAEVGRWLSRDPIGERGGLNLYGFVNNDSIYFVDVLGMGVFSKALTLGAKKSAKAIIEELIEQQIKHRIRNITKGKLKKEANQLLDDLSTVEGLMSNSWWFEAICFVPYAGDALDAIDTTNDIRNALKKLDELTEKAKKLEKKFLNSLSNSTSKLANKFGVPEQQVKDAIHDIKNDALGGGGSGNQNPDVFVDPSSGQVFPQVPGGGVGDTIGNIFNYL